MRPALNLNMLRGVRANADLEAARRAFLADDEELTPRDLSDDWFDFLVRKEHCHVGTPDYVALRALAEKLGVKAQITPIEYPAMLPSTMTKLARALFRAGTYGTRTPAARPRTQNIQAASTMNTAPNARATCPLSGSPFGFCRTPPRASSKIV